MGKCKGKYKRRYLGINMRSIKYIGKYLKINNCNFEIVGLIGNNWVVNFNQMYLGYFPVNGDDDILRRLPIKFTGCEDSEYLNAIGGEYWFFGLKPDERECAYLIIEGGGRVDTNFLIRLK
jgi:hypothetical protein